MTCSAPSKSTTTLPPRRSGSRGPAHRRSLSLEAVQQAGDLAARLGPDGRDAGLGDDPCALGRHRVGGHVGVPVTNRAGPGGQGDRTARRRTGPGGRTSRPARGRAGGHLGASVQVAGAGAAEQPLDRAADHQVDPEGLHVDRDGPGRLVGVEQDQRPPRGPGRLRRPRPAGPRTGRRRASRRPAPSGCRWPPAAGRGRRSGPGRGRPRPWPQRLLRPVQVVAGRNWRSVVTSRLRGPVQSKQDRTWPARTDTLGPSTTDPAGAPNSPSRMAAVARICASQPVQATTPWPAHSAANRARRRGPCPASARGCGRRSTGRGAASGTGHGRRAARPPRRSSLPSLLRRGLSHGRTTVCSVAPPTPNGGSVDLKPKRYPSRSATSTRPRRSTSGRSAST